jgi:hypothetical protein
MDRHEVEDALGQLRRLIEALYIAQVKDRRGFKAFMKDPDNQDFLNEVFGFDQLPPNPKREPISSLVMAHFHGQHPIIGLNYTHVAHNTLHALPETWTTALRLCRGIVFDRETVELLALPWEKFFNYGGHPETCNLQGLALHGDGKA